MLDKDYSPEDYEYLSKLSYHSKQYQRSFDFLSSYIGIRRRLSKTQRLLFVNVFKKLYNQRKSIYDSFLLSYQKDLADIEEIKKKREEEKEHEKEVVKTAKETNISYLRDLVISAREDVFKLIDEYISILRGTLIKNLPIDENEEKVFYLKHQIDANRYRLKYMNDQEEIEKYKQTIESLYTMAYDASKKLLVTNSSRLAKEVSYAVYLYEDKNDKENAIIHLKNAAKEIESYGGRLNPEEQSIYNLIKDNIIIWSEDTSKRDENLEGRMEENKDDNDIYS